MTSSSHIPLTIATLYAELLDLAADDHVVKYREGGYAKKTVSGKTYWYRQRWIGPRRIQDYLGPETPDLLEKIGKQRIEDRDRRDELARRRKIVQALRRVISMNIDRTTVKLLKALAEADAFSKGAILIGSLAYGVYSIMLGRKFKDVNTRTGDVDFAAIQLAVETPISFLDIVTSVDDKLFAVPPPPGSRLQTKIKMKGTEYRVELFTPMVDHNENPVPITNLKFAALPLPYLDFLIREPVEAVIPADAGISVKVPSPERYALHKLIVAQSRKVSASAKRLKDLAQADELLTALRDDRPDTLAAAWEDLKRQPGDYAEKAKKSLSIIDINLADLERGRPRR
jgi:hypothetical protein